MYHSVSSFSPCVALPLRLFAGWRRAQHSPRCLVMVRKLIRAPIRTCVRTLVGSGTGLRLVNVMHRRLSPAWRQRFYYLCCDPTWRASGRWTVDVAGRRIILPLTRDFPDARLSAIGFHGYDPELHALYEALLRGPKPPPVVFDVGPPAALHTLRFLAHGARVRAFEPKSVPSSVDPRVVRCQQCRGRARAGRGRGGGAATVVLAVPAVNTCMASIIPEVRAAG